MLTFLRTGSFECLAREYYGITKVDHRFMYIQDTTLSPYL